jgi:hypothetical protein
MKSRMITMVAVAVFVTTLAAASVRAQNAGDVAVSIPFEFSAGGKTLPAGDYLVRRSFDGAQSVMRIESRKDSLSMYLPTHSVESNTIQEGSKLVFTKYGEQLFLSQVWSAGRSIGAELNKTKSERGLQQEIARRRVKPETVSVAVRSN